MISREQFLENLKDSGLLSLEDLWRIEAVAHEAPDGEALARLLTDDQTITQFQAEAIRERKFHELIIGGYVVLDRIGAGGMGTVYRAKHRRMKRIVALKVLPTELTHSGTFLKRFEREVEAIARLAHPNIVMAFDAGEAEIGHFLVMEYVEGRDLHHMVRQWGPLPVWEAVGYIIQAAKALVYSHYEGIIHRDIKPSNLMRDKSGIVKVADLGLARFHDCAAEDTERSALTQTGAVVGTIDYLPPEQAEDPGSADHRMDIYSLGCTLYYLLKGSPPFRGENTMAILLQHHQAPIPSLREACPDVPPCLEEVYRRMMAKKPAERYATMAEVVGALVECEKASRVVTMPKAPAPSPTSSTLEFVPGQSAADASRSQSALLIEPSRFQSSVIRKLLEEVGLQQVECCQGGQQALDRVQALRPGVIVSAMQLADMDAIELLGRMRERRNLTELPFILISSEADVDRVKKQVSAIRNVTILLKPFGAAELRKALAGTSGAPATQLPERKPAPDAQVLIVDDSASARRHIRGVLGELGFQHCTEADDGTKAVVLLETRDFDLVVTDYNMPEMDGQKLVAYIRKRSLCRAVPVIMTTTETNAEKLAAIQQLGVLGICDKSFKTAEVRSLIEESFAL
ncbi:MAG: response regulator [Gemmataceae bacterium]